MTLEQRTQQHTDDGARVESDYARELVAAAEGAETVELPSLIAVELLVLGGLRQAVFDGAAAEAWDRLAAEAHYQLADEVIDALVQRGLLEPRASSDSQAPQHPSDQRMRMNPALAMILVARTFPTWLAMCGTEGGVRPDLCAFGLGDEEDPYRGVVLEEVEAASAEETPSELGPLTLPFRYSLTSVAKAAEIIAKRATSRVEVRQGPARFVDFYRHLEGEPMLRHRMETQGYGPESLRGLIQRAIRAMRDS